VGIFAPMPDRGPERDHRAGSRDRATPQCCQVSAQRAGSGGSTHPARPVSGHGDGRRFRRRHGWRAKLTGANQVEAVAPMVPKGAFTELRHSGGDMQVPDSIASGTGGTSSAKLSEMECEAFFCAE